MSVCSCVSDSRRPLTELLPSIKTEELCAVASKQRDHVPCVVGSHNGGGFNIIIELVFADGVVWLARVPRPEACFQGEECTASYAATLRYLKKHSRIPVPEVYSYGLESDEQNAVGASFLLMQRLPGHPLPSEEHDDDPMWDPYTNEEEAKAEKVHQQLADIILELASFQFDKIGTLQEDSHGNFAIGPFVSPIATASPAAKTAVYDRMSAREKGPYATTAEFYDNMAHLSLQYTREDLNDEDEDPERFVNTFEMLKHLWPHFVMKDFNKGPFVIQHDDLNLSNILVDDDFNITGIIDLPGTVGPLPSLFVYPYLFRDGNIPYSFITERKFFLYDFVRRSLPAHLPPPAHPSRSARTSEFIRARIMASAIDRQDIELSLLGSYAPLVVPRLFKKIYGREWQGEGRPGWLDRMGWWKAVEWCNGVMEKCREWCKSLAGKCREWCGGVVRQCSGWITREKQ
ncbi:MAG: hypothetical protein M1817_001834 [Caeruleum heppii]|nr:MAG: hypothetical protein M1817_001834 [Caeruleum heppii]